MNGSRCPNFGGEGSKHIFNLTRDLIKRFLSPTYSSNFAWAATSSIHVDIVLLNVSDFEIYNRLALKLPDSLKLIMIFYITKM